ncbi:redoxin domain-containing protein [Sporosarcina luteola]|uniref:TlpA family protein disulfide reductase n=1 Tax=Sporosarcina luteola TaxID=582850 RepID=UPI00203AF2E8|nr:redoxin domain-containing protein [Sporosarcina luteola]MCM3745296.1 redoxin domain-containing protein [Sporosarcina luteola]
MKRTVVSLLMITLIGWVLYDFIDKKISEPDSGRTPVISTNTETGDTEALDSVGVSRGQIAPDFELQTLEGETIRLSDYRGQRVFINFWATWCPPCRAEMPDIQKISEDGDVVVLAVNLAYTERNQNDAARFVDELDLTFSIPLEEDGKLAEQYRVFAYPTSYLIDSEGRVQFVAMGAMNYDMMRRELNKLR